MFTNYFPPVIFSFTQSRKKHADFIINRTEPRLFNPSNKINPSKQPSKSMTNADKFNLTAKKREKYSTNSRAKNYIIFVMLTVLSCALDLNLNCTCDTIYYAINPFDTCNEIEMKFAIFLSWIGEKCARRIVTSIYVLFWRDRFESIDLINWCVSLGITQPWIFFEVKDWTSQNESSSMLRGDAFGKISFEEQINSSSRLLCFQ